MTTAWDSSAMLLERAQEREREHRPVKRLRRERARLGRLGVVVLHPPSLFAARGAVKRAAARPTIVVPRPGGLTNDSVPPAASARSRRPSRPVPPAGSAPPRPSSEIVQRRTPPSRTTVTVARRRVGVLGDVGQRLGDDVVDGRLEVEREPLRRDVERRPAAAGARRRGQRALRGRARSARPGAGRGRARAARRARGRARARPPPAGPGRPRGGRSATTRATRSVSATETSRDCAPSCRLRSSRRRCSSPASHEPGARGDQVRARLRGRDAQRDELAERAEAVLGVGRQRVLARDPDRAPEHPADHDRRGGGRAVAGAEALLGARSAPVVDAGGRRRRARPAPARSRRPRAAISPSRKTSGLSRLWRPTITAVPSPAKRRTTDALTCSTRAHSSDTPVKIRSGVASEATSVATRRSAFCSFATPRDLDQLRLGVALQRLVAVGLAVGQVDPGGDQPGAVQQAGSTTRPAGGRRPWSSSGRPAGSACRSARRRSRNSPNASRLLGRDHELARVAAEHLLAREPGRPLARLVEEQDAAVRSYTQTSDCVVSVRIRANESPMTNSWGGGESSIGRG